MDKITKDTDRDYFMSGEEAKEYGLVDEVVQVRHQSLLFDSLPLLSLFQSLEFSSRHAS